MLAGSHFGAKRHDSGRKWQLGLRRLKIKELPPALPPVFLCWGASCCGRHTDHRRNNAINGVNVYIERVRSGLVRFGVDIRVGSTIPAHISVIGQCILAFLSPASLDAYIAVSRDRTHNSRDKRSAEDVSPTLAGTREKGYVVREST